MIRATERNWTAGALDFVWMLIRWKRLLFWNTFLATSLAIAGAYTAHEIFEAKVVIMPPSGEDGSLTDFMQNFPLTKMMMGPSAFLGSSTKNSQELFLAILDSRTLHMDAIEAFDLRRIYVYGDDPPKKKKPPVNVRDDDLLTAFRKNLKVVPTEEATVEIFFKDGSPARAAAICNYLVKKLDARCKTLAVQAQKYQRLFLTERLEIVRRDLASAESALVAFQKKHKLVSMEEQAKATIEEGAILEAKFLSTELDLEMSRRVFQPGNPIIQEKELGLLGFRRQRDRLATKRESDLLIPYALAPDLGMEFVRLTRNFKIQEALFEFLLPQYEQAKIEEARNTPNLQVLDVALPPQKKIYPPKRKMVQLAFAGSLFLGMAMAYLLESYRKYRQTNPAELADLRRLRETVFSWKFLRA